jgi:hypothetical protein
LKIEVSQKASQRAVPIKCIYGIIKGLSWVYKARSGRADMCTSRQKGASTFSSQEMKEEGNAVTEAAALWWNNKWTTDWYQDHKTLTAPNNDTYYNQLLSTYPWYQWSHFHLQ